MNILDTVRSHVLKRYQERADFEGMVTYNVHIKHMVEYAIQLAKKLNADEEIVEIAAWLHDIGRLDGTNENHHIVGAEYSEKFLRENGYYEEKIQQVKHCILTHRGSVDTPRETIEAKCIASADAMAHFGDISAMFYWVYVFLGKDMEEGKIKVRDKLTRSFNKMVPEAQEIVKEKYDAAMKILQ